MPTYGLQLPLLQNRLPLFRFFCKQLGSDTGFKPLRDVVKSAQQGYADDGHSHFYHIIVGQTGVKLSPEKLSDYDLRIKRYAERLNQGRTPPVLLLYFQWLGVVFSEWFLDRYFTDEGALRKELNAYLTASLIAPDLTFRDEDLTKIAFWMATGSGKTLIMHINMWQVQHYAAKAGRKFDNVMLVTPNEVLSKQHLGELTKSGIAARHYGESASSLLTTGELPVTVIEITKLTENKRGGGLSVDVEAFGPNNLLFVDEGHRGASGDEWRALRERVAEKGFTFEYSATFGQIVNGAGDDDKREELLNEYAHAILFDYSYPHFYEDGYGKDYWVVNVRDDTDTFNDWIMMANLLSFFEQVLVYEERGEAFRPFAIEPPLWVFVGHSVTGGKTREDQASLTDVEEIVAFFDKFLKRRAGTAKAIERLLAGDTCLKTRQGEDIFQGRFEYLRQKGWDTDRIFDRTVRQVFHGQPGETLRAATLKIAEGEIGLRVGSDRPYFGVINIGDVPGLMKLLEEGKIACEDDAVHPTSLFDEINEAQSPVNVLIGARKFMEGWDSFRVASMGLMNIGRGEGSQIIQLFGRGVRLHGKANTLKRSGALESGAAPKYINLLETLNIFGVRANYMQRFREELQKEGIDTDLEIVEVRIRTEEKFLKRGLQVLRLPDGGGFTEQESVVAQVRDPVRVTLDLRPRVEMADSGRRVEWAERAGGEDRAGELRTLAALFDWDRIYFDLLEYKHASELDNLAFTPAALREIIEKGKYELYCADNQIKPAEFSGLRRNEDVACAVLRKYLAALYSQENRAWEQKNLRLADLAKDDQNLNFERYEVTAKSEFAKVIGKLVKDADALYKRDISEFPTVHFDRHLYQPLLAFDHLQRYDSTPPALNEGETKLVKDFRDYLQKNPKAVEGKEVFLLRNLTRGHGIGFFNPMDGDTFYPDFILWVIDDGKQTIVFIDPHGLGRALGLKDPKIQLHRKLVELQPTLQAHCPKWKVRLTSFIVSPKPYDVVKQGSWVYSHTKEELAKEHILFQEGDAYVGAIWNSIQAVSN
jgi:hypothetical protein